MSAAARTGRVTAIGSINLDHALTMAELVKPGETVLARSLTSSAGGKSFNQVAAARLLGADAEFVGVLGDDEAGRTLVDHLDALGVAHERTSRHPVEPSGQAFILVDEHGENSIVVASGANATLAATDDVRAAAAEADVLLLALEVPVATITDAIAHAVQHHTRVVLNPSPFQPLPDEAWAACDVVIVNEHELGQMVEGVQLPDVGGETDALAEALATRGLARVVVTLGANGALVIDDGAATWVPPVTVTAVDTTGCGDAFAGAIAYGLADGQDLTTAARLAVEVGAFAATRPGASASYPTREELDAWRRH